MYRIGNKVSSGWRHKKAMFVCVLVAGAFVGLVFWYFNTQDKSVIINPAAAVTSNVQPPKAATKTFKETDFSLALPASWIEIQHQTAPFNVYFFKNTTKYQDARSLDIYLDTIPTTMAVNKLFPVTVNNNELTLGDISDDCSSFTGSNGSKNPDISVESKWEGINFLCDTGNPDRNVVGTGSAAGINKFIMSGPKTGSHSFFFVYTDHTAQPEYQTLSDALNSLKIF